MHKNLKHAVIKHLGKKKYSQFSDSYYNNSKHFLRFHIKQYWPFQGGNTRLYYTLFQGSYQTILKLSGSYCQIKVKHIFRVYIKHYWHFQGVTPKHYYTFFQTSDSTDISKELLANNIIHFSRAYIKQYWHFQRVADKQYYTLFQSSYQVILIFSKRYWQAILHTFQEHPSKNTDIFRELLANNTTHFSRVYIKQYWHFQRVTSKLNYNKSFFQISYHKILTLSKSYCQTMLT